jgi:hypothetical protein
VNSAKADGIPVGMLELKEVQSALDNGWLSSFSVKAVLMCRSRLIAQVWVFDCMVNILVTTFVMSMIGVIASLLAVYAAALFA